MNPRLDTGKVFSRIFELYTSQASVYLPAALILYVPLALITGAVYTGTTKADVFRCGKSGDSVPIKSTLRIRVTVTAAQPLDRAWLAGAWRGQMVISSPYTSTSTFYCNAFKLTTSISAGF